MYKSREAKVKKQKETHSEIERKRRERMKRETEFLSNQLLDNTVRKDKLSIYKAGAEQLLNYTEKLGKRDFILNDSEYSAIIVNNFSGISLQIMCSDGEIFWCHDNIKSILGIDENAIIGNTIYNVCEPSFEMTKIIENNLSVDTHEEIQLRAGELISRNFIVRMKVSDKFSKSHCSAGIDGKWYRYIELCGDISLNAEESGSDDIGSSIIYKCLGRTLDMASVETSESPSFYIKLHPETFQIVDIMGDVQQLLGLQISEMIDKNLADFIVDEEKHYFKNSLNECISKESLNLLISFRSSDQMKKQFSVSLNAVFTNKKLLFIIGKFEKYSQKSELVNEDVTWIKSESIEKEAEYQNNNQDQEAQSQVTFELEETDLTSEVVTKFSVEENQNELSDCEYLPSNDSFKSLIGDCNDLFYPESIQDLVLEDINDIPCDDVV